MHFRNSCGRSTSYCSIFHEPSSKSGDFGVTCWIDAFTSWFERLDLRQVGYNTLIVVGLTSSGDEEASNAPRLRVGVSPTGASAQITW